MNTLLKDYYTSLHIDERVFDYCQKIEDSLKDRFAAIDAICEINQMKVIKAMQDNRLAEAHLQVPPDMVIPMMDEMHSSGSMQMYSIRKMRWSVLRSPVEHMRSVRRYLVT